MSNTRGSCVSDLESQRACLLFELSRFPRYVRKGVLALPAAAGNAGGKPARKVHIWRVLNQSMIGPQRFLRREHVVEMPGLQATASQQLLGVPGDVRPGHYALEVGHAAADRPGNVSIRALIGEEARQLAAFFQHGHLDVAADRSHRLGELGTKIGAIILGTGALNLRPCVNMRRTQLGSGNDLRFHIATSLATTGAIAPPVASR